MASKYDDTAASLQVIGCIINNPSLLDDAGTYFFRAEDFTSELHKVVFTAIGLVYANGGTVITPKAIDDTLSMYPEAYATYKASRGNEWFVRASQECEPENFDLYYSRLKKMTLLREYDKLGVDMSWFYDPDELDSSKRQRQMARFDATSIGDISSLVEDRLLAIRSSYVDNASDETVCAGDGIFQTLERLKQEPEFGAPLYGPYINTVVRGARLTKFYLRSAPTGVGKSRMMIADVCNFACDEIYDTRQNAWVPNGPALPTLYISTELELQEVQTMCIAFLSGVNEEHILLSHYDFGEEERVMHACEVLSRSKLYVDIICDFSLKDIENSIKRNHREHKVMYVGFDYIMTTMKILEEITSRAGGVALREDNILFMMSVRLKDLANELGIFILSSTQLNASFKTDPVPDQNLLRGAKSVADKIDAGFIALDVTEEDLEKIAPLLQENPVVPNVKLSVYKNRRGSFNRVFLWMYADKGTCRYETLYATTFQYQPIKIDEIKPDFVYEEADEDGFDF